MKISSTSVWAIGFMALMIAVALGGGALGLWQALDHRIFAAIQKIDPVRPDPGIQILDIEYAEELKQGDRPQAYRSALTNTLQAIAALPVLPRVVVLDIWFSNDTTSIAPLAVAIRALRARGVRVICAFNVLGRHGELSADPMAAHEQSIYRDSVDAFGHVMFEYAFGVLKYQRELALPVKSGNQVIGQTALYALPLVAVLEPVRIHTLPAAIVVPLGDDELFGAQTHRIRNNSAAASSLPTISGAQYVVIGSLAADSDNLLARPGPLLLAWALSDLLAGRTSVAPVPLNRPLASLLLGLMGALASWSVFAATFSGLRSRVSAPNWTRFGVALCFLSCLIGLALLLLIQFLVVAGGRVAPLAWPAACVFAASLLAFSSGIRWINDTRSRLDLEGSSQERAIAYDVFISYAHDPIENREWVRKQVYAPLSGLRRADGRPIRIFFDERSIEPGRQWKRELELALLGTRCFIPIYSDRYFESPYCREEIELADQLRIEGRIGFVPIARVTGGIPERYLRKVQYLDAARDSEIGAALTMQVVTLLERAGPKGSFELAADS